jgi:hypothetical protein
MTEESLSPQEFEHLMALAQRLEADTHFMAWVMKRYQLTENLTVEALAQRLNTTPQLLTRLALCKRPDFTAVEFPQQLQQLANYTGIQAAAIEMMLRATS